MNPVAGEIFGNVEQLEFALSEPTPEVVAALAENPGDIVILGVAGKMGPSLARMINRASGGSGAKRRIIGVSRFSSKESVNELEQWGIETIKCDLLDECSVEKLPDAPNVIYLAGMKFGSTGQESLTWAMNTCLPTIICKKFSGSRIVALSTGNIYGLSPVIKGGSIENDTPAPVGEYAMSCLGRERIFEHFSRTFGTRIALIRLNYACDLRYGVLVDLAQRVWNNQPVDVAMGHFNTIWQGDANAIVVRCLSHASSPPFVLNLTGAETLTVRDVCHRLGELMNRTPCFTGSEQSNALLSNSQKSSRLFGNARINSDALIEQVAHWVMRDNPVLNKPTHFESRDGKF